MLDLAPLLPALSDDAPSGADMEYDPEFVALTLAAEPGEERVVGDSVIPAEDPDYRAVAEAAEGLLARTRDLRVAEMLANAALRTRGLTAFAEVLRYMQGALEDHWDSVHPQLDEEDDNDPTARVNAVLRLTDRDIMLAALRTTRITTSRTLGQYSLRDLQLATGEASPASGGEEVPSLQTLEGAMQDTDPEHLTEQAEAVAACLTHVAAISAVFDERIGARGPDLSPLSDMLGDIQRWLANYVPDPDAAPDEAADDAGDAPAQTRPAAPAAPRMQAGPAGAINTPAEVKAAIDRIVAYYDRVEPSSPVPLLLKRARRLVSADFVTIMRDMAPQGVENVAVIGGFDAEEEEDEE